MEIDRISFVFGLIYGVLAAGFMGVILGKISLARNGMGAPDRPMSVQTKGTPRGVMAAAARAARSCAIWSAGLVALVVLAIFGIVVLLGL